MLKEQNPKILNLKKRTINIKQKHDTIILICEKNVWKYLTHTNLYLKNYQNHYFA